MATIGNTLANPEHDRLQSTSRQFNDKIEAHNLYSKTFGGRSNSFGGQSPSNFFSNHNRKIYEISSTLAGQKKQEKGSKTDEAFMQKLVALNQHQKDLDNAEKYIMSPDVYGDDKNVLWRLMKAPQYERSPKNLSYRNNPGKNKGKEQSIMMIP